MIINADCMEAMQQMIDDGIQVDSIVTDPPYELGFMNKVWDKTGIANNIEMWKLCIHLLKPGGHLLSFGGSRTYHRMACAIEEAGFEIRDQIMWVYGSGFPKSLNLKDVREGWGTALKPAHEPIILARKPLSEKTVVENVIKHGTGGINIDECRIDSVVLESEKRTSQTGTGFWNSGLSRAKETGESRHNPLGRFPANLIHDGSDEVEAEFAKYGERKNPLTGGNATPKKCGAVYGKYELRSCINHPDTGTASRFFYSAKASKKERNGSKHPTVKPIALMRYLCRLITPPGGIVLDPFAGTGTTGQAAKEEGFDFILIEKDETYILDIQNRLGETNAES